MRLSPRRLRPSRRVLAVLVLQAGLLGLLATGALGTQLSGPSIAALPLVSAATDAGHDTSPALTAAPEIPNDPNRNLPELERQQSVNLAVQTHDTVAQTAVSGPAVPATDMSFPGIKRTDLSVGFVPPDTVGDVGPTQYLQAVNGGLDVFSKTGTNLTGAINDTSFWNGLSNCAPTSTRFLTDPTVNYDEYADRWVYAELSYDTSTTPWRQSYMCVAVSTTGDATDTWNRYVFATGNGVLTDYPKMGVWPDGYYFSFNDFDNASPHSFVGAGALVVERAAMLTGSSAQSVFFDLRNVAGLNGGMLPADADGATAPPNNAPDYFVSPVNDPTDVNDQLGVWAFHVDWAAPLNSTFTNPQALQVAGNNPNTQRSVAQPGTITVLDGLADDRLMNRAQYRNFGGYETLVTDASVDNGSGGLAPRWYELRKTAGSWAVNQQSTYNPDALNRWIGSVAMDGAGDMALGYSAGDASTAASLRYTGRLVGDSLSTMEPETVLAAGGGVQTGTNRWGDYSQLNVDPTDDCTFWFTGEYYTSTSPTSWATRIGSFRFPSCVTSTGPTASVLPAISGTQTEGSTLSATAGTWSTALTSTSYQWRRCSPTGVSCVDIGGANTNSYTLQAVDAGMKVRVKVSVTAATGNSYVVSAATNTIAPLAPVSLSSPSLSGTTIVGQTLTGNGGTWSSYANTSTNLTYQWQRCAPGCADIPTGTASTYTLQAADGGATVRVVVTATNIGGSTSASSAQTSTITFPPPPVNTAAPAISGTVQEGQTLTVSTGTWTGQSPITYSYQWQQCNASGVNCADIGGQTSTSYTANAGDVGLTLRAGVNAANPGGNTIVYTSATRVVTAASSGGGGSSGGGSSGGSGSPDLVVSGAPTNAAPAVGDTVLFLISVSDANGVMAQSLNVNISLGAGLAFVSGTSDRGSGCRAAGPGQAVCYLDYLSGAAPQGKIELYAKVVGGTGQTLTATATAQQGVASAARSTLTLTLNVKSAGGGVSVAPVPGGLNTKTTTTTKTVDRKAPTAHAIASSGARGKGAKLRFRIYDDRGTAKAVVTVKRSGKIVGRASTGFGPVAYGSTYYVGWQVPLSAAKGRYTFCVVAFDHASNRSPSSCATLSVK